MFFANTYTITVSFLYVNLVTSKFLIKSNFISTDFSALHGPKLTVLINGKPIKKSLIPIRFCMFTPVSTVSWSDGSNDTSLKEKILNSGPVFSSTNSGFLTWPEHVIVIGDWCKKWKKWLLCKLSFEDVVSLRDNYQNYHNVDAENFFLKELFETEGNRFFAWSDFPCCGNFLETTNARKIHIFF